MKNYDVLILGAGASGLMCAANLSKKLHVGIVDTNTQIARKVKISGGGKCNITNSVVTPKQYLGDEVLITKVFKKFSSQKLLNFLERGRVELELRKERYYFCKRSSDDIIELLQRNSRNADLLLGEEITTVHKDLERFFVETKRGNYSAKALVVATGGESFKNIGASAIGLKIAKNFGLNVKPFEPALVGLTLQKEQFWMKELSGLSCYVHISVGDRVLKEEMLFAHRGISGPAVLSASLYWKKGEITIDFLPHKKLENLIKEGGKKRLSSVIPLPKRLIKALFKAINFEDKECIKIDENEQDMLKQLNAYTFAPAGNFGFSKAEVSRGGVMADELDFDTLEAKKVQKLYFIGEVVDITGELGGYNFQWAFSSAYVCAKSLNVI
jgi:predicted Rossmann fold flavoprotein